MYDAIAPYHPTAVGSYTRFERRPAGEAATNRGVNTAVAYAGYRSLLIMAPQETARWRGLMVRAGLDPDDGSMDPGTPQGIGNSAAASVIEARRNDGFNQFGGRRRTPIQPDAVRGHHGLRAGQHRIRAERPVALAARARAHPGRQLPGAAIHHPAEGEHPTVRPLQSARLPLSAACGQQRGKLRCLQGGGPGGFGPRNIREPDRRTKDDGRVLRQQGAGLFSPRRRSRRTPR